MRGDSGVAGEGRVAGIPKIYSWGKYTMPLKIINLDCMSNAPMYYLFYIILFILSSKVTAPQDAHGRLALQVYLGLNTSDIRRLVGFRENAI